VLKSGKAVSKFAIHNLTFAEIIRIGIWSLRRYRGFRLAQLIAAMSKFIRFLSRRRTGRGINKSPAEDGGFKKKKGIIACKVVLLDGTDLMVELPVRSTVMMR